LPRTGRSERRAVLMATAVVGVGNLSVGVTHLSVVAAEAQVQLRAALDTRAERSLPRILMGDFNMGPAAVAAALEGRDAFLVDPSLPTFPSGRPRARIDHLVVAGATVNSVAVLDEPPVSDHRALVVELEV
ncbi:MAG: endonuclease/exonuclease/phosphatase family protein, partial [Acidimicrobiales bacterium]